MNIECVLNTSDHSYNEKQLKCICTQIDVHTVSIVFQNFSSMLTKHTLSFWPFKPVSAKNGK